MQRRGWGRARATFGCGLRQPLGRCARHAPGFELLLLGGMLPTVPLRRWLSRWIRLGEGRLGLGGGRLLTNRFVPTRSLHARPSSPNPLHTPHHVPGSLLPGAVAHRMRINFTTKSRALGNHTVRYRGEVSIGNEWQALSPCSDRELDGTAGCAVCWCCKSRRNGRFCRCGVSFISCNKDVVSI